MAKPLYLKGKKYIIYKKFWDSTHLIIELTSRIREKDGILDKMETKLWILRNCFLLDKYKVTR